MSSVLTKEAGLWITIVVYATPTIMAELCTGGMEVGKTNKISAKRGFRINLRYMIPFILFVFVVDWIVSSEKICCSTNYQYIRRWPCLEIELLQK